MSSLELLSRLEDMGITCDRRTLYADIEVLNSCGYEILCKRSACNEYYVKDRDFSVAEVRILMDAVQSADFITDWKSRLLVEKLSYLVGSRRGETLIDNLIAYNNTKTDNPDIYHNVEIITSAIQQGKQVVFKYFDYDEKHNRVLRRDGAIYEANPYGLVMDDDNYYFLCYVERHKNMIHYRVDRMCEVQISEKDKEEIKIFEDFDIKNYKKQLFGMFGGETETIKIRFDKCLLDTIFDTFGVKTRIFKIDEQSYETMVKVQVSPQFYGWCLSFGDKLKVVEPTMVVEDIKDYIESLKGNF